MVEGRGHLNEAVEKNFLVPSHFEPQDLERLVGLKEFLCIEQANAFAERFFHRIGSLRQISSHSILREVWAEGKTQVGRETPSSAEALVRARQAEVVNQIGPAVAAEIADANVVKAGLGKRCGSGLVGRIFRRVSRERIGPADADERVLD